MPSNDAEGHVHGPGGKVSLGSGGLCASVGDHIAHFYRSARERRDVAVRFYGEGLERGELCVYITDDEACWSKLAEGLRLAGIDINSARKSGQFIHQPQPGSTPEEMVDWFQATLEESQTRFPLVRWGGDMSWSLRRMRDSRSLMQWETACNEMDHEALVFLCQYDLSAFPGSTVIDAMHTHPVCIIGGAVQLNPFYLEPQDFLEQLQDRHVAH